MKLTPEYITKAAAGRLMGMDPDKVATLIKTDLIPKSPAGKPLHYKIRELASVTKTYKACTPDEFLANQNTAFFVPLSKKGIHLDLPNGSDAYNYIAQGLSSKGYVLPRNIGVTDAWRISDKNAEALVRRNGFIFGVTAGYVVEVARVVGLGYLDPLTNLKYFLIEKLSDTKRDSLQGKLIDQITQTGRYYWL